MSAASPEGLLRPGRRHVLALGGGILAVAAAQVAATRRRPAVPILHTRPLWYAREVTAPGGLRALDTRQAAWLARGVVPGAGTAVEAMVREALLDLHRLTSASGALAAGPARFWRYAWPRDTAFAAVALGASGHHRDALAALRFLARVQRADGGLEARYLLDGSGVPDARPLQSDGPGWVLWALGRIGAQVSPGVVGEDRILRELARRCLTHLLALTADGTRLPPVTPDYWEVRQSRVSLGLVAPMLAGLHAAAGLGAALGNDALAARATRAAAAFGDLVHARFGPSYQRHGDRGGRDAATAMLMPPFVDEHPGVVAAWEDYQRGARRPAGGLSPGTSWWQHGESWTPETALVAWTAAASGRHEVSRQWLDWLDSIRTSWGALPEKVLPDGRPAGPAPLAWTAALVVLTAAELERA